MSYSYYLPQGVFGMQFPQYGAAAQQQHPYAAAQYAAFPQQAAYGAAASPYAHMSPYAQLYQQAAASPYAHQLGYPQSPQAQAQAAQAAMAAQAQAAQAQAAQAAQQYGQQAYGQQQQQPYGQQYAQQPAYGQQAVYGHPQAYPGTYAAQGQQQQYYNPNMMQQGQTDAYGLPLVPGDITLQQAEIFILMEKVLSATRDSFTVKDVRGALRYRVEGSFSIHERKSIKNIHGQTLIKLKEARMKMREKITFFNSSDVPLFTLQQTQPIQIGTKKMHGYLGAVAQGTPSLVITGNSNNTHFRMVDSQNREVAVVRRKKYSAKNVLTGQDTYEVNVQLGSPALILFIVVALDEIYED